jgi:hypothetical protein
LGLAGGYLRYLYDTWRNREAITGELDAIKKEVRTINFILKSPKENPLFLQKFCTCS